MWLPHQGVRVEGAPGFARSVRTPFHRGCTARRPPLGAHRRPVRVRGASAPSPARGWCGWGLPPGGVRARQAKLGARAMVGVSVPGAHLASGMTSAKWHGVGVWTESADASPPSEL